MDDKTDLRTLYAEMEEGIPLAKCQQCGCMRETLDNLAAVLPMIDTEFARDLTRKVEEWSKSMQPIQYACLGCAHCYAGAAQNALAAAFPNVPQTALSCDFEADTANWPPVVGEYSVVNKAASVAVSTLANPQLAEDLAQRQPAGLAIVGKTETENIGLDKVIKNVITNSSIHFLIVAGTETIGHRSGQTLIALAANGVDDTGRVIGSLGKRPILRNVTAAEIQAFRVQVIDMIGGESVDEICSRIEELSRQVKPACTCAECAENSIPIAISSVPTSIAAEPADPAVMDKAGYFVIVPLIDKRLIHVEHYAYDNTLLQVIEGATPRALYSTIVANNWVSELSHAAYLGKELAKAEAFLKHGNPYIQDGA
jgi:tetrahydromethanopterin S-methyltransferase subunit A